MRRDQEAAAPFRKIIEEDRAKIISDLHQQLRGGNGLQLQDKLGELHGLIKALVFVLSSL